MDWDLTVLGAVQTLNKEAIPALKSLHATTRDRYRQEVEESQGAPLVSGTDSDLCTSAA